MAEMTFNFQSLKIDKRFHTIDVSGFADFIIMQRYKFNRSLPPAYRQSEKYSDLWLPTTKLMRSPIEPHRIRVPDNMAFRNGQIFPIQWVPRFSKQLELCPDKAKKLN